MADSYNKKRRGLICSWPRIRITIIWKRDTICGFNVNGTLLPILLLLTRMWGKKKKKTIIHCLILERKSCRAVVFFGPVQISFLEKEKNLSNLELWFDYFNATHRVGEGGDDGEDTTASEMDANIRNEQKCFLRILGERSDHRIAEDRARRKVSRRSGNNFWTGHMNTPGRTISNPIPIFAGRFGM